MSKKMQCKNIPDLPVLEMLAKNPGQWHNWYFRDQFNVASAMPAGIHEKLILGKMRMLMRRGLVDGCDCGCRGDFVITQKGLALLADDHRSNV